MKQSSKLKPQTLREKILLCQQCLERSKALLECYPFNRKSSLRYSLALNIFALQSAQRDYEELLGERVVFSSAAQQRSAETAAYIKDLLNNFYSQGLEEVQLRERVPDGNQAAQAIDWYRKLK